MVETAGHGIVQTLALVWHMVQRQGGGSRGGVGMSLGIGDTEVRVSPGQWWAQQDSTLPMLSRSMDFALEAVKSCQGNEVFARQRPCIW